jgi:hypothetical protein
MNFWNWNTQGWNWVSVYWLLWIVVGFLPMELDSLLTGRSWNTLSDQVWRLEGDGPTIPRFVVGAFMVWLTGHFCFKLWRTFHG